MRAPAAVWAMRRRAENPFMAELGWTAESLDWLEDSHRQKWWAGCNLDRKFWSLEMPYETGGAIRPMFPGLVMAEQGGSGIAVDIPMRRVSLTPAESSSHGTW